MKRFRRSTRSAMFFGVLLSVVSTFIGLWFGGDKVSAGESVLIGLVGLGLSFQVDILLRMDRRERFVSLIDGPPWVGDTIARIAGSLETINDRYAGSSVDAEAEQRLTGFAVELDELAQGRVRTGAEDVRHLITETRRCKATLVGITNLQPGPMGTAWWNSEIGQKYWKTNVEAMERGVKIGRIFITDNEDDPALKTLVDQQCAANADVYVVPRESVPPKYQRNIAIWDDTVAWEADMNAAGLPIENVYSHSRHDVERLKRVFDLLQLTAHNRQIGGAPGTAPLVSDAEVSTGVSSVEEALRAVPDARRG